MSSLYFDNIFPGRKSPVLQKHCKALWDLFWKTAGVWPGKGESSKV